MVTHKHKICSFLHFVAVLPTQKNLYLLTNKQNCLDLKQKGKKQEKCCNKDKWTQRLKKKKKTCPIYYFFQEVPCFSAIKLSNKQPLLVIRRVSV